jgi:hypothetical protein
MNFVSKGPTMLKSRLHSPLLLVSGIVFAGLACSSPGTDPVMVIHVDPTAGTGSTAGGSPSGGTGAVVPTAGTTAMGGSASGGQAGSAAMGGSGGTGVVGGTGGTGGGTGGTGGGTGGTGGLENDPNKVVLFDGTEATFKSWKSVRNGADNPWKLNADKTMTVNTNTGDIQSKMPFQDVFLHLEYMTPKITSAGGGQERGNSGVYLKGSWELQVLDTFGLAPAIDGCGAIYEVSKPLVTACHKEEEWNIYEVEFKAQVCNNGQQTTPARFVEVKLNDILVQQNVDCPANETRAGQPPSCDPKGLLLQDHSSILPVSYRNIWVIPRN